MVDGKFTAKERAYLASLPAVESVSASRIRYSDRFRVEAMCRYNAGESPSAIFREAGLDPKLIGYKRVERCIARWKQQERDERRKGPRTIICRMSKMIYRSPNCKGLRAKRRRMIQLKPTNRRIWRQSLRRRN